MGLPLTLTIFGPEAGAEEEKGMRLRAAPVSMRYSECVMMNP
jgi:hypothetical protein